MFPLSEKDVGNEIDNTFNLQRKALLVCVRDTNRFMHIKLYLKTISWMTVNSYLQEWFPNCFSLKLVKSRGRSAITTV